MAVLTFGVGVVWAVAAAVLFADGLPACGSVAAGLAAFAMLVAVLEAKL